MVVICAGTTGFNLTMDARFLWMRQKRVQGSHFANLLQASQANQLVIERRIDPCMSEVFDWADMPNAHTKMWKNKHKPGNMAVLVARRRRACAPSRIRSRPAAGRSGESRLAKLGQRLGAVAPSAFGVMPPQWTSSKCRL